MSDFVNVVLHSLSFEKKKREYTLILNPQLKTLLLCLFSDTTDASMLELNFTSVQKDHVVESRIESDVHLPVFIAMLVCACFVICLACIYMVRKIPADNFNLTWFSSYVSNVSQISLLYKQILRMLYDMLFKQILRMLYDMFGMLLHDQKDFSC